MGRVSFLCETHEQLTSEGFIILPVSVINIAFGPC